MHNDDDEEEEGAAPSAQLDDISLSLEKSHSIYSEIRLLKQQTRHDISCFIRSIHYDSLYLESVVSSLAEKVHASHQFPLLGNLRNGLWYSPSYEDTCYFKSTDGHTYKWNFSLTRLNVNVLKSAIVAGGVIIADSTRRGKSFPDALSKTIPIWCAVLNAFMAQHFLGDDATDGVMGSASTSVHLPPFLSPSEGAQINSNIPRWLASLAPIKDDLVSHIALASSSSKVVYKPLRPVFVCPSYDIDAVVLEIQSLLGEGYRPVVCVSVSNSDLSSEEHRERHSWPYMQGAGDDEESWSQGLQPEVMWKHMECQSLVTSIISTRDVDMEELDEEVAFMWVDRDEKHICIYEGNNVTAAAQCAVKLFGDKVVFINTAEEEDTGATAIETRRIIIPSYHHIPVRDSKETSAKETHVWHNEILQPLLQHSAAALVNQGVVVVIAGNLRSFGPFALATALLCAYSTEGATGGLLALTKKTLTKDQVKAQFMVVQLVLPKAILPRRIMKQITNYFGKPWWS